MDGKIGSMCARCAAGVAAAWLSGCEVGPRYQRPQEAAPAAWGEAAEGGLNSAAADLGLWWASLGDPELSALVERAVAANHELRIAEARLREARAERLTVAAGRVPEVDATGEAIHQRISPNIFPSLGPGGFVIPGEQNLFQLGFDATWELDVFGRVRRSVEAAGADVGAAEENRRDVLVTMLAEVARNYVEARAFQRRLEIARLNIAAQRQSAELTRARFAGGVSSELDATRAEALLATTESEVPTLQTGFKQAVHRLGVLIGREPGALMAELAEPAAIPAAPDEVRIGAPADVVRRRPDIRRAERELAAATARVGVATADLYPRFSLTGSFGFQSAKVASLFDSSSRFYSIGPALQWPIFDAGRIRANIGVQEARTEQALEAYEQTVLRAFEDVENAMVAYAREQERRVALGRAVDANERSVELAGELYGRGLADFLSVLDAQRALFQSQDQLAQSTRAVTSDLIAVYKALGGGWEVRYPEDAGPASSGAEPAGG
jgi:multidrug efflux system outer membrane protein